MDNGKPFKTKNLPTPWFNCLIDWLRHRGQKRVPRIHATEGYQTHSWKAANPPPDGMETIVVLRDPIKRLHSAWKNKVCSRVFSAQNALEDLTNECLPLNPDFGTFIDLFDQYRQVSRPARIHTNRFSWHLGEKIEFYDHVFMLESLNDFISFISKRANSSVSMPHRNKSQGDTRNQKLSHTQIDRLVEITAPDYAWLKGLYDAEKSLSIFRQ